MTHLSILLFPPPLPVSTPPNKSMSAEQMVTRVLFSFFSLHQSLLYPLHNLEEEERERERGAGRERHSHESKGKRNTPRPGISVPFYYSPSTIFSPSPWLLPSPPLRVDKFTQLEMTDVAGPADLLAQPL